MEPAVTALLILALVIILYVTEAVPLAVTSVGACALFVILGVTEFNVAFSGFSSSVVFLVGGMIVVGAALFETGLAHKIGRAIIRFAGYNDMLVMIALMTVIAPLSAFLNNSSATAVFISVVMGIAATSKGRIHPRLLLMPMAFASNAGGMLTMVGSTPPLIVQGVLSAAGEPTFGFFEFSFIGLPILIMLLIYSTTIGYRLQQKTGSDKIRSTQTGEPTRPHKIWTAGLIMLMCIVLFIFEPVPLHVTAVSGALLVIITGCLNEKEAYQRMDWTTVLVLAGSMGMAASLDQSGAGRLLADTVISWLGPAITPVGFLAAVTALAMILTQVMSNTATTAMLAPIALFMCSGLGISYQPVMMALATGGAAAFATPVATPPNTLVLCAGYRFTDYIRVGGLFSIIAYVMIIMLVPLLWPF